MLCRHCKLLVLLVPSGCAQPFREAGSFIGSDWVGKTAACIQVPLFHEPWLTCWFYSTQHDILQKQPEAASCGRLRRWHAHFWCLGSWYSRRVFIQDGRHLWVTLIFIIKGGVSLLLFIGGFLLFLLSR